jgi:hypothetical protein
MKSTAACGGRPDRRSTSTRHDVEQSRRGRILEARKEVDDGNRQPRGGQVRPYLLVAQGRVRHGLAKGRTDGRTRSPPRSATPARWRGR